MPWDANGNLTAFDTLVGTPAQDAQFWQMQTTPFTCAVMAQCGIIGEFTHQPISEAQLVYEATVNGWLSDGGMSPLDVGNLLELHVQDPGNQGLGITSGTPFGDAANLSASPIAALDQTAKNQLFQMI